MENKQANTHTIHNTHTHTLCLSSLRLLTRIEKKSMEAIAALTIRKLTYQIPMNLVDSSVATRRRRYWELLKWKEGYYS